MKIRIISPHYFPVNWKTGEIKQKSVKVKPTPDIEIEEEIKQEPKHTVV